MKKILAMILASAMLMSLAACGGTPKESSPEGGDASKGKVAIITGTVSQGEEELQAAKNMEAKYGDRVVTATYPDNFSKEQETTISNVVNLVSDPDVKALVFVQAVPGAAAAIAKAREIKPDLLVIAGMPGEDPGVISEAADIVLSPDEIEGMGVAVPTQAKAMGAKTLVHYSFPRHMGYATLSARRDLMKKTCEELGITFVDATAPDPNGDAGIPGAQQYILEDVPKMIEKYGADTAFFSTNCAMQEPLIKSVAAGKALYPQPCCPSPFHGFPGAFGIEIPADKAGDIEYAVEAVTAKVAEAGMSGRMSTWPVPVNMAMIEGGTEYALKYIDGEITEKVDKEVLAQCLTAAAKGKTIQMSVLKEGGKEYPTYFTLLSDYITF